VCISLLTGASVKIQRLDALSSVAGGGLQPPLHWPEEEEEEKQEGKTRFQRTYAFFCSDWGI